MIITITDVDIEGVEKAIHDKDKKDHKETGNKWIEIIIGKCRLRFLVFTIDINNS